MHNSTSDSGRQVQAYTGFSSAGADFRGKRLTLDSLIVTHPAATFFLRAEEESSLGGWIHPGDILVVDRAADIVSGCLVVAVLDGDMVVRQLLRRAGRTFLRSGRPGPSGRKEPTEFQIWGKVVYVLHPVLP